ncbi:THO complex subunit 3 [Rhodotorula toruloides]|nr:THO complex subunit 3 [Rhodotorula toruloides]
MVNAPTTSEDFSRFSLRRLGVTRERVRTVAWNLDGRRLAAGGSPSLRIFLPDKDDKALHFWDIRQGSKPTSTIETYGNNIHMNWSPDGKTIVVGTTKDRLMWVDVEEQRVVNRIDMDKETNDTQFSHNGSLLYTGVEGSVRISAFPSNELVYTVPMTSMPVGMLDLDPRGRYLLAGGNDATVSLWETEEWTCAASAGHHDGPLLTCRFNHDGSLVASIATGDVVISSVPGLKKEHSIPFPDGASQDLAWHPSRNVLAYAGNELCIWGYGV